MKNHSRLYSVLSYMTWIGWVIALLKRDKDDSLVCRHLNQGLVLNIAGVVSSFLTGRGGLIGRIGDLAGIAILVLWIMGVYRAAKMSENPLPLIGDINLIS